MRNNTNCDTEYSVSRVYPEMCDQKISDRSQKYVRPNYQQSVQRAHSQIFDRMSFTMAYIIQQKIALVIVTQTTHTH